MELAWLVDFAARERKSQRWRAGGEKRYSCWRASNWRSPALRCFLVLLSFFFLPFRNIVICCVNGPLNAMRCLLLKLSLHTRMAVVFLHVLKHTCIARTPNLNLAASIAKCGTQPPRQVLRLLLYSSSSKWLPPSLRTTLHPLILSDSSPLWW